MNPETEHLEPTAEPIRLPPEMWFHILSLLPKKELKNTRGVSKNLYFFSDGLQKTSCFNSVCEKIEADKNFRSHFDPGQLQSLVLKNGVPCHNSTETNPAEHQAALIILPSLDRGWNSAFYEAYCYARFKQHTNKRQPDDKANFWELRQFRISVRFSDGQVSLYRYYKNQYDPVRDISLEDDLLNQPCLLPPLSTALGLSLNKLSDSMNLF